MLPLRRAEVPAGLPGSVEEAFVRGAVVRHQRGLQPASGECCVFLLTNCLGQEHSQALLWLFHVSACLEQNVWLLTYELTPRTCLRH